MHKAERIVSEAELDVGLVGGVPGGRTVVTGQRGVEGSERRRFAPSGAVDVRQVAALQDDVVVEVAERLGEEGVHLKVLDRIEGVRIDQVQLRVVVALEEAGGQFALDGQVAEQLEGDGQLGRTDAHALQRKQHFGQRWLMRCNE